jgi:hypothetical protein
LKAVADWAENEREFWERSVDSLGEYLKSIHGALNAMLSLQ